jgi:hypothetical protein
MPKEPLTIKLPPAREPPLIEPGQSLKSLIGESGEGLLLLGVFDTKSLRVEGPITRRLLVKAEKPLVIHLQDSRSPYLTYFGKLSCDPSWRADMRREYEMSQRVLKGSPPEELAPCPSAVLYHCDGPFSLIVWPEILTDLGQSLNVRGKLNSVRDLYQLLVLIENGEVAILPGVLGRSLAYLKEVMDRSGVVHFDVKPENILVSSALQEMDPGTGLRTIVEVTLLLADFGSAYPKINPDGSPLKLRAHQICGTEEYTNLELRTLKKKDPMGEHVVGEGLLTDDHAWNVVGNICQRYEKLSIKLARRVPIPYLPKTVEPPPIPEKARPSKNNCSPLTGPIGSPAGIARTRLWTDSPQFGTGAFSPADPAKRRRTGD